MKAVKKITWLPWLLTSQACVIRHHCWEADQARERAKETKDPADWAEAEKAYGKALDLVPLPDILVQQAQALKEQGKTEEAARAYTAAVRGYSTELADTCEQLGNLRRRDHVKGGRADQPPLPECKRILQAVAILLEASSPSEVSDEQGPVASAEARLTAIPEQHQAPDDGGDQAREKSELGEEPPSEEHMTKGHRDLGVELDRQESSEALLELINLCAVLAKQSSEMVQSGAANLQRISVLREGSKKNMQRMSALREDINNNMEGTKKWLQAMSPPA